MSDDTTKLTIKTSALIHATEAVYDMPWRKQRFAIQLFIGDVRYEIRLKSDGYSKLKNNNAKQIEFRLSRIFNRPVLVNGDVEKLGRYWWEEMREVSPPGVLAE